MRAYILALWPLQLLHNRLHFLLTLLRLHLLCTFFRLLHWVETTLYVC